MAMLKERKLKEVLLQMSKKERIFCEEMMKDMNASAAARRAGYKPNIAGTVGYELLKKQHVILYLDHLKTMRSKKTGVTAERVVKELAAIAFLDIADLVEENDDGHVRLKPLDKMKRTKVIKKIKITDLKLKGEKYGEVTEIELWDKMKALEALGKHTAIFTDNINITTNGKELPAATHTTNIIINHRKKGESIESDE